MNLIKRAWQWFDDRSGVSKAIGPILQHPVPPNTGWKYVFGSAVLFCFLLQVVTGVALATLYVPSTDSAYKSLEYISHSATLGWWLRGLHYFGASGMFLFVGIHMIRVFLTGSFKFPRELNWLSGVVLLGCVIFMGFTGQLLRWDQNGIWSTAIAAEQAGRVPFIGTFLGHFIMGGETVGAATLSRFFTIHVFVVPGLIFAVVGFHLYLVIRNGISEPARSGHPVDPKTYRAWYKELLRRSGEPFFPNAAWRDVVFGTLVIVAIVILAAVFKAPELAARPDAAIIQAEPRPDWYLLWYYAVLALSPHYMENYLMVLLPLLGIAALVLLPFLFNSGERSVRRRPWSLAIVIISVLSVGVLWIEGKRAPWSPDFKAKPLEAQNIGNVGATALQGAQLFHDHGCEACHTVGNQGGHRGPNLTFVADRLTVAQMTIRIVNGGNNMPAFGGNLDSQDLRSILAFLETRTIKQSLHPDEKSGG